MFLSDSNGQNTKAVEYFSKLFFMTLADSDRKFRQFLQKSLKFNLGVGNGDTFTVSIVGELALAGAVAENVETPTYDPTVTKTTVTVLEYASKIKFTDKLRSVSQLKIEDIFRKLLSRQAAQTLDKAAHDLVYATTNLVAWPTSATAVSFATNSTVGTPNTSTDLTLEHIKQMRIYAEQNRIPSDNGYYYFIGTPTLLGPIESQLLTVTQYTDIKDFRQGEIGSVFGVRIVKQNNVITKDGYFLGDEAGMEVVVKPEQIVMGEERDIGRSMELGWKALIAFSKIQNNRIIKFDGRSA